MRIKISTTLQWPIERQIPAEWEQRGIEVVINQPVDECDAWIVYQGLRRPERTAVPPNCIFFFGYEPPGLHRYQPAFLAQFAAVVTCHNVSHPNAIRRHQAQPWLAGVTRDLSRNSHRGLGYRLDYNGFASLVRPPKTRLLSAVCSRKVMFDGHSRRLEFIEGLERKCRGMAEIFGYGFRPLQDKWDALAPYHYHLVVENSCVADYWTEKVSDAFLAWCRPIVWGCPNLSAYFPSEAFLLLDPSSVSEAVDRTLEAISKPPSPIEMAAVEEARRRVLDEYNLFAEILRLTRAVPPQPKEVVRLKDERLFLPGGWWRPLARFATDKWRFRRKC